MGFSGSEALKVQTSGDFWLYIGEHLALDVGGLHQQSQAKVNLAGGSAFGLSPGGKLNLSFFGAHRYADVSTLALSLTVSPSPSTFNYQVQVDQPVGVNYKLLTAPAGMSVSPSGLLTWTPSGPSPQTVSVVVQATNSAGPTTQAFSITLTP